MLTDDLDFDLPPDLIAQVPTSDRAASRLLHYNRATREITHHQFSDLPALVRPGDLMVFNDAKVIPARFRLRKSTGGCVEGLFLSEEAPGRWRVLLKNLGPRSERPLHFEDDPAVAVTVAEMGEAGEHVLDVATAEPARQLLARLGRMPLPPYIRREKRQDVRDEEDRHRYQTVFAKSEGSVAAPTAGLHFTDSLLASLDAAGVQRTALTLHVGLGTFKPVTSSTLESHAMHTERYEISAEAADVLNRAKAEHRRIIAIGTTSARVMESQAADLAFIAKTGQTDIFIYPPYVWKHVGALITNFHLPRSTLIALVAAMVGLEEQRRIYQAAIAERYRFFSYGDAMLVE